MNVLFLAFANSRSSPLPTLSREDEGVFSALVHRALKGHFFIHRDSFTTVEKISEYLGKYSRQLSLFLYSGHAGGQAFQLDGEEANARGVALQLGQCAKEGNLRIVILNGCSTAGQVQELLDAGVPVVVATSAEVEDRSATEFSVRFFQCLSEKRLNIREAFEEALGPAQTATSHDIHVQSIPRGINLSDIAEKGRPLWGLYCKDPELLEVNPLPLRDSTVRRVDFEPNEKLTNVLFQTLLKSGCRDIRNLMEKEEEGEYVETGDKQTAIVNVLPFPVAINLQKLLCPVEQENEGFDKISRRRLEQIGTVFHTTMEFLSFIMLAQLWELKLEGIYGRIPRPLREMLLRYFNLPGTERLVFDFLPFMRSIQGFFDELKQGRDFVYFVEEFSKLKTLLQDGHPFHRVCAYLTHLQRQCVGQNIAEADVPDMCEEAENSLCDFFAQLGFLHQYILTSVQNIDIQKYRHHREPTFKHEMIKLMRAFGKPEQNFYLLPNFLDNRGVVLIKGRVKVVHHGKKQFKPIGEEEKIHFLNLSPFVIDRNAFEEGTDLSNLLFFEQFLRNERKFIYKNVKRPTSQPDRLEFGMDGPFEAVYEQLDAFRAMILNENNEKVLNGNGHG